MTAWLIIGAAAVWLISIPPWVVGRATARIYKFFNRRTRK